RGTGRMEDADAGVARKRAAALDRDQLAGADEHLVEVGVVAVVEAHEEATASEHARRPIDRRWIAGRGPAAERTPGLAAVVAEPDAAVRGRRVRAQPIARDLDVGDAAGDARPSSRLPGEDDGRSDRQPLVLLRLVGCGAHAGARPRFRGLLAAARADRFAQIAGV